MDTVFFAQLLFKICFVPSDVPLSETTLLQDIIIHTLIEIEMTLNEATL